MSSVTATAIPRSAFPWYLTSSSLWMAAMSLQGFLITWMLVGVLQIPADRVGFGRAMIEMPGLVILLIGGVLADRSDGRRLLIGMHLAIAVPSLVVAAIVGGGLLSFWAVVLFGIAVSGLQAASDPARQSILSRVTRTDIQRTVTLMTIVTSIAGLSGVWLGGQLDRFGLVTVLILQAACFAIGADAARRLPPLPPAPARGRPDLLAGVKATWQRPLIRNIIGLNFLSSLVNAGAYVVAIPFIVKEVYRGDATFFATVMMVFTTGSIGSNVVMLRFMPLLRPGRLFLLMQLTRVVILGVLWTRPALWLFYTAMFAWGVNMGVTTTLVRTTVQELAGGEHRAQILSVLLVSFMISAPLSSLLLGNLIAGFDPLTALLPGVAMSLVIFAAGLAASGLWQYEAPAGLDPQADGPPSTSTPSTSTPA
ncbi:MAG TPA: MFS transporter [Pseudomonadales bacterium]|nr:MFS transporter [Pseudomonadales bacterium]